MLKGFSGSWVASRNEKEKYGSESTKYIRESPSYIARTVSLCNYYNNIMG